MLNKYLQNVEKEFGKLFVVHRIDRGTSGILCFARNEAAQRHLSLQFQNHEVKKIYSAIVKGKMKEKKGIVDAPIAENMARPGSMLIHKRGKNALTLYEVEEEFKHASFLKIEIKTGRTHQIRVHLSHRKHPLVADAMYGGAQALGMTRQALHAARLAFVHPITQEACVFTAPLPDVMAHAWSQLNSDA